MALVAATSMSVRDAVGEPATHADPVIRNDDPKVKAAKDEAEKAVQKLKKNWASAEARNERKASRTSFRGQSPTEAKATALAAYGRILRGGTTVLPPPKDGKIKKYLGSQTAVVEEADGKLGLALSTLPLTVGGTPVDLTLAESPDGFRPRVSAADVLIPKTSSGRLQVGDLDIAFVGVPDATAVLAGDSVMYPNAATDADLLIKPVATGAEVLALIRSPQSPETFELALSHLGHQVDAVRRQGDQLELLDAGETVGSLSPAFATDAQGKGVEVETKITEGIVSYTVLHHDHDLAYPILLDPYIEDSSVAIDWGDINGYPPGNPGGNYFADWAPSNPTGLFWQVRGTGSLGTGVYQGSNSGTFYPAESPVNWHWHNPQMNSRTNYIYRANFDALYSDNSGEEYWTVDGLYSQRDLTWADVRFYHRDQNFWNITHSTTSTRADTIVLEWRSRFDNSVGRQQYLRHVRAYIRDPEDPTLHSVTGTGKPGGWTNASNLSVTLAGSDPGIGIYSGNVKTTNNAALNLNINQGCQAHPNASPCPSGLPTNHVLLTGSWSTTGWADGVHNMEARVTDSLKQSAPQTWSIKLDKTRPTTSPSGPFVENQGAIYGADDSYELWLEADDATSGVADITVKINGSTVFTAPGECSGTICEKQHEAVWTFIPQNYAPGSYTISINARDLATNVSTTRSYTVQVAPAEEPSVIALPSAPVMELSGDGAVIGQTRCAADPDVPSDAVVLVNGGWAGGTETTEYYSANEYNIARCTAGKFVSGQHVMSVALPDGTTGRIPVSMTTAVLGGYRSVFWTNLSPLDRGWATHWTTHGAAFRSRTLAPTKIAGAEPPWLPLAPPPGDEPTTGGPGCRESSPFRTLAKWDLNSYGWILNSALVPSGNRKSAVANRIKDGHRVWNNTIDRCGFRNRDTFTSNLTSERNVPLTGVDGKDDGENVVGFASGSDYDQLCDDQVEHDTLACAIVAYKEIDDARDHLKDVDVAFDAERDWFSGLDRDKCAIFTTDGDVYYDLFVVASHESGHALGLRHVSNEYQVMSPGHSNCANEYRTLGRGDIKGLRTLYPNQ